MIQFTGSDRPVIVAIAGPNGAGKTTFFNANFAATGLRFVNADVLADELGIAPYQAARVADGLRRALVNRGESFAFETVFSDPVGEKLAFLQEASERGFEVILCFIGVSGPAQSVERVAIRVLQGGHDVPSEKLEQRFARTLDNLRAAIMRLPHVSVFDNSDLARPFRLLARFDRGQPSFMSSDAPAWLPPLL